MPRTTEEGSRQVNSQRLLPDLRRGLREPRGRQHGSRADESRERPGRLHRVEEALDIRGAADVRRHRRGLAARIADACHDAVEGLTVAGGQHDARTGRRDRLGRSRPTPAAGAGDDRQAARQPVRASATACDLEAASGRSCVELLVSVETQLQIEMALGMITASRA